MLNRKLVTLKKNKEFNFVYRRGKSFSTTHLTMIWFQNRYGGLRFGYSVSKKVGKAVVRNKIRRRLKDISQTIVKTNDTDVSANIIFIARKDINEAKYSDLEAEVRYLLKKAKIL